MLRCLEQAGLTRTRFEQFEARALDRRSEEPANRYFVFDHQDDGRMGTCHEVFPGA